MAGDDQIRYALLLRGAQEGLSGNQMIAALRQAGIGMRRQQFYRLWGTATAAVREAGVEPTRPLDQVPTLSESTPFPAGRKAEPGYLQTVRLVYLEPMTGKYRVVYHSTKSAAGVTRQQAITNAIDAYAAHSEEYETTLVGAAHTSTLRIVPEGKAA